MKFIVLFLLLVFVMTLEPPPSIRAEVLLEADLVFKNGNIYTVDQRRPKAEAVAVKADRIVFVGTNSQAQKYVGPQTRVVDLNGKTMVPGLTDAHQHLSGVGFREMTLNLEGVSSLEQFLAKVKARVDQAKPGDWVTGRGWIETFWKPPVFPTRWDLDKIAPNNPVFLDAAQDLVQRHIPATTQEQAERAIELGVQRDIGLGWTQVQDPGGSYAEVALFEKLYAENKIKLRIYKGLSGPGREAQRLLREGTKVGSYGNRLTVRMVKLYADGSLGSRSAALLQPYSDKPDTSGFLTIKEEELQPFLQESLRKGIQVQTHAIGDRGNRFILDQYEKAMNAVPRAEWKIKTPRWRIEHSQIVNPVDIPRFTKLGVIPSMQPSHAIGDLHFAPSRLGIDRLAGAYAWQSFIKSGAIIPGGSDAPVERGEPMIEFYAAVARKDMKGFSGPGWHPEEAATREQALKMFTTWAAFAAFEEELRGSIEAGKLADFTILSGDIMKIPGMEILKTRCLMTVIGGEIVYEEK